METILTVVAASSFLRDFLVVAVLVTLLLVATWRRLTDRTGLTRPGA